MYNLRKNWLDLMSSRVPTSAARDRRKVRRRSCRPHPEPLEERLVLTVVFDPVFQKESVVGSAPFNVLNSPTVYLIFWGTGWGQGNLPGPSAVTTLTKDAQAVLSSTFFGALGEYGNVGTPVFGGAWTDSSTDPPAGYNPGGNTSGDVTARQSEIANAIAANPSWAPPGPSITQSPIYVVIPVGGSAGYNEQGTYNSDTINICSVGGASNSSTGATIENWFTQALSHELAERITDPGSGGVTIAYSTAPSFPGYLNETTNPPSVDNSNPPLPGDQAYAANGGQIGDGEQELGGQGHYGYLLNGVKVQSLWSASTPDKNGNPWAFIVTDGNSESVYLDPIWTNQVIPNPSTGSPTNPPITGPVFTGNYNLTIEGHAIGMIATDGLTTVTVDNEIFAFANFIDGGQIQNITLDPQGANATVSIVNLAADQTVSVQGTGADTVTIGAGGSASTIQGVQRCDYQ